MFRKSNLFAPVWQSSLQSFFFEKNRVSLNSSLRLSHWIQPKIVKPCIAQQPRLSHSKELIENKVTISKAINKRLTSTVSSPLEEDSNHRLLQVGKEASKSVVLIEGQIKVGGQFHTINRGTGFVVGERGVILTCAHVVKKNRHHIIK